MISIVAAIGINNELGKNNKLIWNLPKDLLFFKRLTERGVVVMGYKTFESIGHLLPNRKNVIITHRNIKIKDAIVCNDIDDLVNDNNNDLYIIGGAKIYEEFLQIADNMYITEINQEDNNADTFFPVFDMNEWDRVLIDEEEENNINYQHVLYKRLK